jgi:hypothetical protein
MEVTGTHEMTFSPVFFHYDTTIFSVNQQFQEFFRRVQPMNDVSNRVNCRVKFFRAIVQRTRPLPNRSAEHCSARSSDFFHDQPSNARRSNCVRAKFAEAQNILTVFLRAGKVPAR